MRIEDLHSAAMALQGRGVASDATFRIWREDGAVRDSSSAAPMVAWPLRLAATARAIEATGSGSWTGGRRRGGAAAGCPRRPGSASRSAPTPAGRR